MSDQTKTIIVTSVIRNGVQFFFGFLGGLWFCADNQEAAAGAKGLIDALAPWLVPLGGAGGLAVSLLNSFKLLAVEPPK